MPRIEAKRVASVSEGYNTADRFLDDQIDAVRQSTCQSVRGHAKVQPLESPAPRLHNNYLNYFCDQDNLKMRFSDETLTTTTKLHTLQPMYYGLQTHRDTQTQART